LTPATPTRERRSYPGAADPSDHKWGTLSRPRIGGPSAARVRRGGWPLNRGRLAGCSATTPLQGRQRAKNPPAGHPEASSSRGLRSVRRVAPDKQPPGAPEPAKPASRRCLETRGMPPTHNSFPLNDETPPTEVKAHPREVPPSAGERHSPGRPRVGTTGGGLGHQLGSEVTQYVVRGPDVVSGRPTGLGAVRPSVGASDTDRGPGSRNTLSGAPTWCPNPRPSDRARELSRPASGTRTGRPGRSRPSAHTSPRDPRSCVLPWSRRWVSRVLIPKGRRRRP
jgi:hypothetical protein